jgi:hypothetical protein
MKSRLASVISLVVLALLLAGCGAGEVGSGLTLPEDDPDRVIVEVRYEGGFAPPEWLLGRAPRFALTSGGTLYFEGPQTMEFPGRLLPPLMYGEVDAATMDRVEQLIAEIGFAEFDRLENTDNLNWVADAPTDVVTYFDREGGAHVFAVYALGLTDEIDDPKVLKLAELVRTLEEASFETEAQPYTTDRVEVYAGVRELPLDPEFDDDVRPWPLPQPFAEMQEAPFGFRCAVYEGEQGEALLETFQQATQVTNWEADGTEYVLRPRPLLPHEEGCRHPEVSY